uniref:Uncharacterized protein n=1 Tax=Arundo donax TaxID=35708 RepID=A0A0A9B244_ARUDO
MPATVDVMSAPLLQYTTAMPRRKSVHGAPRWLVQKKPKA